MITFMYVCLAGLWLVINKHVSSTTESHRSFTSSCTDNSREMNPLTFIGGRKDPHCSATLQMHSFRTSRCLRTALEAGDTAKLHCLLNIGCDIEALLRGVFLALSLQS